MEFFTTGRPQAGSAPNADRSPEPDSRTATPNRAAGQALLALVQRDSTPSTSPTGPAVTPTWIPTGGEPARPVSPTPAPARTPPGVHHSPFKHIRPPLQTLARPPAPPPGLSLPKKSYSPQTDPESDDEPPMSCFTPAAQPVPVLAASNVFSQAPQGGPAGDPAGAPLRHAPLIITVRDMGAPDGASVGSGRSVSPSGSAKPVSVSKWLHELPAESAGPPGLTLRAPHAPYALPSLSAPPSGPSSATSTVGPNTPRQGPAVPPLHTLLPSPTDDEDSAPEDLEAAQPLEQRKGGPPGLEKLFVFAEMDFPGLSSTPNTTQQHPTVRAGGNRAGAPTGASTDLSDSPAQFWQQLQKEGAASSAAASAKTPPAPAPHPLLAQLRGNPAPAPAPASSSRSLPPPVTLPPPPHLLPRPVTLPRPDGAALLEKLKRGPVGSGDPGKAILRKLQKGSANGPPLSAGKVDALSEAAKQYLESKRIEAQGAAGKGVPPGARSGSRPGPKTSPVDLMRAGVAAREAAHNALKGGCTPRCLWTVRVYHAKPVNGVGIPRKACGWGGYTARSLWMGWVYRAKPVDGVGGNACACGGPLVRAGV
jgi:hypothetical protein